MFPWTHDNDEPFLRPWDFSDAGMLTNGAVHFLREHPASELSVGALARTMRITPQALLKRHPRSEVVFLLCREFGFRWLEWTGPDRQLGLPTRLPRTDAERLGVRIHAALVELAAGEALHDRTEPTQVLAELRVRERAQLHAALDPCGDAHASGCIVDVALAEIHALIAGLRLALIWAGPALTWDQAAEILRRRVAQLVVDNQPMDRFGPPASGPPDSGPPA